MAGGDSRDGCADLKDAPHSASHVTYVTEDDAPKSAPTMMQKVKERISDYENQLKGKQSSEKEDPHPELAYIPPGDGKNEVSVSAEEGRQHGGGPTSSLGKDLPVDVTKDSVHKYKSGGHDNQFSGEGADAPTTIEKIKAKLSEVENHMKGKESSAVEDPHPELSYITPMPQEEKEGVLSKIEHKLGGQQKTAAVPKGTGSSELGTGYEEDGEESVASEGTS